MLDTISGIALISTTTSLGWGLRGVWGHWWGATVPGAFAGMAIWLVYGESNNAWQMLIFGSILAASLTIGAYISTLKIVKYVRGWPLTADGKLGEIRDLQRNEIKAGDTTEKPDAMEWGYERSPLFGLLGVFLAGGMWGFFAGIALGILMTNSRYGIEDLVLWGALSLAAASLSHKILVQGLDLHLSPPRSDAWAAVLGASLATAAYFALVSRDLVVLRSGLLCWLGFGVGYQIGALIYRWLQRAGSTLPSWKIAEHTIGFFGGLGIASSAAMVGSLQAITVRETELLSSAFIVLWLVPYLNISNSIDFLLKGRRLERDMRSYLPALPRETELEDAQISRKTFALYHIIALISLFPFMYLAARLVTNWAGTHFYRWPFIFLVSLLTIIGILKSRSQARYKNINPRRFMLMYAIFVSQALISVALAFLV